jgi:serine phosphatase RsbU (regulator of sigma subunit)
MGTRPLATAPRAASRYVRPPGSITAGVVLLCALVVSVIGSIVTYNNVRAAFVHHNAYDSAREELAQLLKLQLDEETSLRGYLSTGKTIYLEPYTEASPQFDPVFRQLVQIVNAAGVAGASAPILDMRTQHTLWERQIAEPLMRNSNSTDAVQTLGRGKIMMDRVRNDYASAASVLDAESKRLEDESFSLLRRAAFVTAALILSFGLIALVADAYRSRSQAALARERAVTDTLQRAFLSGWDMLPYLRIGTAYVSSTTEAEVGGDLFDVYRLDENRAMVLVADVSGKGLAAAVETALVKYSIRTLVETETDPAVVLQRFNTLFERSAADPGAFVSVFLGIVDDRDLSLWYASAGHGSVFVRRGSRASVLPATGPVIGLEPVETFASQRVELGIGDVVVLATDGLTEARDQAGIMLGEEQSLHWVERGPADPQKLADEIVASVRRYAGGRITDDLALLVIRVQRTSVVGTDGPGRREVMPTSADGGTGRP